MKIYLNGKFVEKENAKIDKFEEKHKKKGCNEGFSFIITPTGIGDNIHVKCEDCRKEKDVSDYGSW